MTRLNILFLVCVLCLSGCSSTLNPAPVSDQSISGKSQNERASPSHSTAQASSIKKKHRSSITQDDNSTIPAEVLSVHWLWPVKQYKSARYHHERKGLDIQVTDKQEVTAAASGTVSYVGDSLKGYGQMVVIKHSANILSVYADNQKIVVKEGELVKAGQVVAELIPKDAEHTATLHFEIRYRGKPLNPKLVLKK